MSCNGCRVLRKGCSESCILRACLQWIPSPAAQGNATLFLARFFGRSDLMSLITAVPDHQRPALFQSLLFEACGRTVNPVNGAVGLLSSGNWHVCQTAVETVLAGGALRPLPGIIPAVLAPNCDESSEAFRRQNLYSLANQPFLWRDISEIQVEASSDLRLSMSSTAAKLASRICSTSRGGRGRSCAAAGKRRRETMSEESEMTSGGSSSNVNKGGSVERKLLNLFV